MHEASLIDDLLRRILAVAAAEGATHVTAASVWLGAFSHMSAAHFSDHFVRAAAGTIAEGAELTVEVSHDTAHQHAQDIVLRDVEVED